MKNSIEASTKFVSSGQLAKQSSCIDCQNKNCFINKHCNNEWKTKIGEQKNLLLYKRGQSIFYEGYPVFGIYFVHSGKIRIFSSGARGKKQVIRLARSGDIVGHRGISNYGVYHTTYPVAASALEDSELCFVELSLFFSLLKENPDLTFSLMLFFAEELYRSEMRQRNLIQMNIYQRVADALLFIKAKFGIKQKEEVFLDLILSRQDLADIAGVRRENVSRIINEYEREGMLRQGGKKISIIDIRKLEQIIIEFPMKYEE